jgi:hypothetical protein
MSNYTDAEQQYESYADFSDREPGLTYAEAEQAVIPEVVIDWAIRPAAATLSGAAATSAPTADVVRFSLQQFALWLAATGKLPSSAQAIVLADQFWEGVTT